MPRGGRGVILLKGLPLRNISEKLLTLQRLLSMAISTAPPSWLLPRMTKQQAGNFLRQVLLGLTIYEAVDFLEIPRATLEQSLDPDLRRAIYRIQESKRESLRNIETFIQYTYQERYNDYSPERYRRDPPA